MRQLPEYGFLSHMFQVLNLKKINTFIKSTPYICAEHNFGPLDIIQLNNTILTVQ